jgi:single-strand selective monofunctional uracil DNA glycosylase
MPRTKRARTKSKEDLPNAKKTKRTNSIVDYMSQIQTTLNTKQNEKKNNEKENNEIESTISVSTPNIDKKQTEQILAISDSIPDKLLSIEQELCVKLRDITFPSSINYIYNPLEYAFETHAMYVRKYCTDTKKILFLGMNPGPWGMSQTGVPFGEISMVRDWLGISGSVGNPLKEHPDRKIIGFQCTRSEVSGLRLWGLFRELCGNTENFFRHAYMHNYCPLAFMDARARNITPAELKAIFISLYFFFLC